MPPKSALSAQKQKEEFRKQYQRVLAPKEAPQKRKEPESVSPAAAASRHGADAASASPALASIVTHAAVPAAKRMRKDQFDIRKCLFDILEYLKFNEEYVDMDELFELLPDVRAGVAWPEHREQLKSAMRQHDKLQFQGEAVAFKPTYNVRNREELLELLRDFQRRGLGGIRVDALQESYKTVTLDVEDLAKEGQIHIVQRKDSKQGVIFFRDAEGLREVDKSLIELWRKCDVAGRAPHEIERLLVAARLQPLRVEHVAQPKQDSKFKKRTTKGRPAPPQHESITILQRAGQLHTGAV